MVSSIPLTSAPFALAYDSANGFLYVVPWSGNFVTVVDPESGAAVATIPTGMYPSAIAFDSDNGYLYVTNWGSANVTVIDGATNSVVGSIAIDPSPNAIAYDPTNGNLYVAELATTAGPSNVTIISGTSGMVIGSVAVGRPYPGGSGGADGVTYDPSDNKIFVSVAFGGNFLSQMATGVAIINGTTDTIDSIVYPNALYAALFCVQYDPAADLVFACDADNSQVDVLDGKSNQIVETADVGSMPVAAVYDPANDRVLIVNNGSNNVTEIDGATGKVVGSVPVGMWPYSAAYDSANCEVYVADSESSNLTVLFAGQRCVRSTYAVTVAETGLPSGTNWTAEAGGVSNSSTAADLILSVPNGTYSYTAYLSNGTYRALSGSFVVDGRPAEVSVSFSRVTFQVILNESGLPTGTNWSVTLNGVPASSTDSTIAFAETNGSYAFSVGGVPGYGARPSSGLLAINGTNVSESIVFSRTPATSPTFLGLPAVAGYGLLAGIVAAVAVAATLFVTRSRRGRKDAEGSLEPPSGPGDPKPPT
jgi:YVTN family beta-propeller protein